MESRRSPKGGSLLLRNGLTEGRNLAAEQRNYEFTNNGEPEGRKFIASQWTYGKTDPGIHGEARRAEVYCFAMDLRKDGI